MPIFPLTKPLSDHELLQTTCHLYTISLLRLLPYSLLCVGIIHYFRYGKAYLPHDWQHLHQQSAMLLLVIMFPLMGIMITIIDKIATNTPATTGNVIKETATQFLSFMGALASIAFIPMILLGLCIGAYFALLYFRVNMHVAFAWIWFSKLLIFASIVPKVYAPWLIFSDGLEANDAQNISSVLVKNHYFKTFTNSLFALLVIVYFLEVPEMFGYYFANIHIAPLWVELVAEGLLAIIGPWSLVFLLTNKYNLQLRKKAEIADPDYHARKQKVQSAIPTKKKDSDSISF